MINLNKLTGNESQAGFIIVQVVPLLLSGLTTD